MKRASVNSTSDYVELSAPAKRTTLLQTVGNVVGVLLLLGLLGLILTPSTCPPRKGWQKSGDVSHHKQMALGTLMYATDNDERFPPAVDWMSANIPYVKNASIFQCIALKSKAGEPTRVSDLEDPHRRFAGTIGHALNSNVGGKKDIKSPETVVVTFCSSKLAWNSNDPCLSPAARYDGSLIVSFADGHAKACRVDEFSKLRSAP